MTVLPQALRPARVRALAVPRFPRSARAVAWPALILTVIGLPMILSASWVSSVEKGLSPYFFVSRQVVGVVLGLVALLAFANMSVKRIRRVAPLMLGVAIVGLIAVLSPLGAGAFGSRRWIALGPLTVQPSELAKLAFVLVGAELVARKGTRVITISEAMRPLGLLFIGVAVLVMAEPDLGTTTILGALFMTLLFVGAAPLRTIGSFLAVGAGGFLALAMSAPYRWARVVSFLDPFADAEDTGYQAVQSIVALGSGGIFGAGFGLSKQKWLQLPNSHTDFIYAVIGEEAGLLGTLGILALFGWLAWAGSQIARNAKDSWSRMAASALTVWLVLQAVVNIGGATSVLPITGVPLPFVSYGNSALIFSMAAIGILVAIARDSEQSVRGR